MSGSYQPSDDAKPDDYQASLNLAYRDIAGKAPIDKVGYPAVHVTPACFGNGTYDNSEFRTCISNLMSVEYRHFIFDIYWDTRNSYFNFCPVQLPEVSTTTTTASPVDTSTVSTSASSRTAGASTGTREKRQTAASSGSSQGGSSISSPSVTSAPPSSTTAAATSVPSTTDAAGSTLYEYGPFQCSNDITLDSLLDIYSSWTRYTANPVQARLMIFQFNLHAAAALSDPTGPAPTPAADDLPDSDDLIGTQLKNSFGRVIYTPGQLLQDRQDLNNSWLHISEEYRLPMLGYYNTFKTSNGHIATNDGWPSEDYILFTKLNQLLVTWGSIGPEMRGYNFANDSDTIFPSDYLYENHAYRTNDAGTVTSGCFYDANAKSPSRVNNTWAMGTMNSAVDAVNDDMVRNMTACGLASDLNATLDGVSAAQNFGPYLDLRQATMFGWAPGNPKNFSDNSTAEHYRCVVIDSSDGYKGLWRLANCLNKYRAACRVGDQPYNWRLSNIEVAYGNAHDACDSGTSFDLPRTGLENTYLHEQILADNQTQNGNSLMNVWVNLNDLDKTNCWVTAGANASCPYQTSEDELHNRNVIIPTIAVLIVLILTGLTILVKCNTNYRRSKHHRTGPGGWEYEGVPS